MRQIATIPYEKVRFRFVSNHYDIHLSGTCIYERRLCRFETENAFDYDAEPLVKVFELTFREQMRARYRQWLFKQCVGYHWSYDSKGCRGRGFHYRNPEWLYQWLFNWFYKRKKK